MARVIGTDVFSYFLKDDTRSALYKPHTDNQFLIISFMTVAEIEKWSLRSSWGARRKSKFEKTLRRYHIQNSTKQLCYTWAKIVDEGRRTGFNIADADAWIAATALYFNVSLITHNAADFKFVTGLNVISEN